MTPPHLPLSPLDRERLAAVVAREWSGDRGVASLAGVDPERVTPSIDDDGALHAWWPGDGDAALRDAALRDAVASALRDLAEALERDHGYAVDWSGGPRVVGWAAARAYPRDRVPTHVVADGNNGYVRLVRIVDLPPSDPRVKARDDALFAAREARRGPGAVDMKRAGAVQRDAAAYPRGGR